jgi:hypothetical protein
MQVDQLELPSPGFCTNTCFHSSNVAPLLLLYGIYIYYMGAEAITLLTIGPIFLQLTTLAIFIELLLTLTLNILGLFTGTVGGSHVLGALQVF